jgi:hypothetical protein
VGLYLVDDELVFEKQKQQRSKAHHKALIGM